jgi:hypothetical protein
MVGHHIEAMMVVTTAGDRRPLTLPLGQIEMPSQEHFSLFRGPSIVGTVENLHIEVMLNIGGLRRSTTIVPEAGSEHRVRMVDTV